MKSHNFEVLALEESIFSTMSKLALEQGAINLAQGFPDFDGEEWIIDLGKQALISGRNQYAPSMGLMELRLAIKDQYQKYYNLDFKAESEIMVCNGATEAIYSSVRALINPGDEVVIFEPFYDSYYAALKMAKADIKIVTLHAPTFEYNKNELTNAVTKNTKLIIVNNPHNPSGKVFSKEELEFIASLAIANDSYVLSDEVYEFLTYEKTHIPFASLANIKDRTITISSIGKTLSLTGWKIGWVIAEEKIIKSIHNTRQFISFSVATPIQLAVALALPKLDEYIKQFKIDYKTKRDILYTGLKECGFDVLMPEGTYFLLAKIKGNDVEYCKKLILEKKVATIPTSAFYKNSKDGESIIRFCFAKKEETLLKAIKNLKE